MDGRPNYYILLGLDPAVEDAGAIEKAIQAKRQEWSRQQNSGNPAAAPQAKANLAMIADIQRVMSDQEARRSEAGEARAHKKAERRKALEELDRMIELLPGETCTTNQVEDIKKTLGHLSDQDIADRLRAKGFSVEKAGAAKPKSQNGAKPQLDRAQMDQLQPKLKLVGAKTLYDFLSMNQRSSTRSLWEHADQRNKDLFRIGKHDAATDTAKALCGQCLAIFNSDANRQKYDNSVATEALDGMRQRIEVAGKTSSFLLIEQQDALVRQARELGVEAADARAFIENYAASRKWGLQKAKTLPSEELQQCGNCLALAKPGASHCGACGFALTIECPRCSNVVPTEHSACTACGFHIGDWDTIKRELDNANKLIADLHIDEAASRLRQLLTRWPGWKAIQSPLDNAEQLVRKRNQDRSQLLGLIQQHKLFEAQSTSERFRRDWPKDNIAAQLSEISEGKARAQKAFEKGERQRLEGKSEEAIAFYRSALVICADYEEVRKAMALVPPAPPKNLSVVAQGSGFQLRWEPGGKTVDDYVVVRKALGAPSRPDDGDHKQATRDLVSTDLTVEEGMPWHYAVYSRRDGVFSAGAARSGPHLRVAPVRNLLALAGDSEVKLTWTLPNGAVGAEVWRRQGPPPERPGVGTRLSAARDSLHNSGLTNDVPLGYLVVPLFQDPLRSGVTLQGPGASCLAVPTSPPAPVINLKYEREAGGVRLSWTPPTPQAQVQVRQLNTAPDIQIGTVLSKDQADAWGKPVLAATKGSAQVRLPSVIETWFVPLTVKGTIAVVGKAVNVVLVDGLQELAVDHDGRDIHLRWEWPHGATQAAVCYSYDHYPKTPSNGDAIRLDVTLGQYRREGMFTMRRVERRPHYFALFAVTPDGRLHSEPLTRLVQMGESREVRYRIVSPQTFFSRLTRAARQPELEMNGFGHLPETVLVAKPRVVPTGPDDGQKLMRLPEMELAGTCRVPIPATSANSGNVAKLFFVNARYVDEIRLVSGPLHELKL
jgi:hypothetical protein